MVFEEDWPALAVKSERWNGRDCLLLIKLNIPFPFINIKQVVSFLALFCKRISSLLGYFSVVLSSRRQT